MRPDTYIRCSEEDERLQQLVLDIGSKHWSRIASAMNGRNGKQCRERWINHLKPDISKEPWSNEEDNVLIRAYAEIGSKWSEMETLLKGRTENAIKNHWHSTLRKRQDVVLFLANPRGTAVLGAGDGDDGATTHGLKRRRTIDDDCTRDNASSWGAGVPVPAVAAALPPKGVSLDEGNASATAATLQHGAAGTGTTAASRQHVS